jgi:hypothetical protein
MVKFQPSKLAMRVRFPLPAHLPMKITTCKVVITHPPNLHVTARNAS